MHRRVRIARLLAAAFLAVSTVPGAASATPAAGSAIAVDDGTVHFAFPAARMEALGLEVTAVAGSTAPVPRAVTGLEGSLHAFAASVPARVRIADGILQGFERGAARVQVRGGFSLRARDPRTGRALTPALLYDVELIVDPGAETPVTLRTAGSGPERPLDVRAARIGLDSRRDELVVGNADLAVSAEWADALGRPELEGLVIGSLDGRFPLAVPIDPPAPAAAARGAGNTDVELFELYDLQVWGRDGPYPTSNIGLTAATTSCNVGDVAVPWQLEVGDTLLDLHPFIGLALFREDSTGVLEMIGKNWIKHGFFAIDGTDCSDSCQAGGGITLGVNCSDTYGVANNASRFYLGPRSEVNPHTAAWNPWGSFFDATPVNGRRNYWGGELSEVAHRLEVWDEDLIVPNIRLFYECVYYVEEDVNLANNVGWEECTAVRTTIWEFTDVTEGDKGDTQGTVISTWGDQQTEVAVAADDGTVWLAVDVTDLGGGQWHYEYALYNFTSDRGIRSFSVPTGPASVTNAGFHDVDKDSTNEWTIAVEPGLVRWETDDWATNPAANAIEYQSMYNFRFDADVPPVAAQAMAGIFKPGTGTDFFVATQAPSAGTTSAGLPGEAAADFALHAVEPNPFRSDTRVAFSLDRRRDVRLTVADVTGRTVRVLLDGPAPAGRSTATWDGTDAAGRRAAAGVYFFRLDAGDRSRTVRGVRLR